MNHFVSGEGHVLHDEPDPGDPMLWCWECGDEALAKCGCCGAPLCGRHHEVQAGFCSEFTSVPETDFPGCTRFDTFIPFERAYFDDLEVIIAEGGDDELLYHIIADDDHLCQVEETGATERVVLHEAAEKDYRCCPDCEREAYQRCTEGDDVE